MTKRPAFASLWALAGVVLLYEGWIGTSNLLRILGILALFNAVASLLSWRAWRVSSTLLGIILALYGLDVLLVGHPEDVGGARTWLSLGVPPLVLGAWSLILVWKERKHRTVPLGPEANP